MYDAHALPTIIILLMKYYKLNFYATLQWQT